MLELREACIRCWFLLREWQLWEELNPLCASSSIRHIYLKTKQPLDEWQRVNSLEELYSKIPEVDKKFNDIKQYYLDNTIKTEEWYYEQFEKRMNEIL